MKPSAYREQVEKEVEAARVQTAAAAKAKRGNDPASRSAAIEALGSKVVNDDATFTKLLGQLGDRKEDAAVRGTILSAIQAQSFASPQAPARRPVWLAAVRGLIDDPDMELRLRAISLLSNEKDDHTQEKLLQGLREPAKALLPPEMALPFLSNDIHAEIYSLARGIVAKPPSDAARLEALRVLGADAESVPLFEGILRDRNESAEVRRLSIAALSTIAPANLRKHAREIVLDEDEDPDVLATSLASLSHDSSAAPADLAERVSKLRRSAAPEVSIAAKRLHDKLSSS